MLCGLWRLRINLFIIFVLSLVMTPRAFTDQIKTPNVSGQFYPSDPRQLSSDIEGYLKSAKINPSLHAAPMIIAPHAGYSYSGAVAGYSFHSVSQHKYKTIVIIAPSHFYGFVGGSVWPKGSFQTPLGMAVVDEDFTQKLMAADDDLSFVKEAFEKEHALEVEIPFVQMTFQDFKIVPVILGDLSFEACQKLAQALDQTMGHREDVLIVISSDMSHYHDGDTARKMDQVTLEMLKKREAQRFYTSCILRRQEMCGFIPVTTALLLAKIRNWQPHVLQYANSGDVTGDYSRVVGYGALGFDLSENLIPKFDLRNVGESGSFQEQERKILLALARKAIETSVRTGRTMDLPDNVADSLLEARGAFVTIRKDGALRGCIGHIISAEPLIKTVRDMAIAAAKDDPRFDPVTANELGSLDLEVSVLSLPKVIKNVDEIELGKHGVIVSQGQGHQGVFLPQVATETGWSKEEFLSQLCSQKAFLPASCWKDPRTKIEIFTAEVFTEDELE